MSPTHDSDLLTFEKTKRLLKTRQFDAVFQRGRVIRDDCLSVHNMPNGLGYSRIGLQVTRKVGPAVRRNRVKRLFREAFRLNPGSIPRGYDFVIIPAPGFQDASLEEVQTRFLRLLGRLPPIAPRRD